MENLKHGETLSFFAAKNGLSQELVAERLGVSPQAVSTNFKKNKLKKSTIMKYCGGIGISYEEFTQFDTNQTKPTKSNEVNQINEKSSYNDQVLKLTKEVSFLWKVIAMNGIKVDASQLNFNLGVSYSAFAV